MGARGPQVLAGLDHARGHGVLGDLAPGGVHRHAEQVDVTGLGDGASKTASVVATRADGTRKAFEVDVLLLTPKEVEYFRHGGLLHYVLRQLAARKSA